MSEEELNEAMQYNLDYTEAMLNDELFGTNEVAEVKLLASEKAIKDLQQKVEQLEKELQTTANNCKQLENIRKETIEYIEENLQSYSLPGVIKDMRYVDFNKILNILSKGGASND